MTRFAGFLVGTALACAIAYPAHATLWKIGSVLDTPLDSNGYIPASVYRQTSDYSGGIPIGSFAPQATGTYDDVTGAFSGDFFYIDDSGPVQNLVELTLTGSILFYSYGAQGTDTVNAHFTLDVLDDSASSVIADDVFVVTVAPVTSIFFDRTTGDMGFTAANGFLDEYRFFFGVTRGINMHLQFQEVPEPASLPILGLGLMALLFRHRHLRRSV